MAALTLTGQERRLGGRHPRTSLQQRFLSATSSSFTAVRELAHKSLCSHRQVNTFEISRVLVAEGVSNFGAMLGTYPEIDDTCDSMKYEKCQLACVHLV